MTLPAGWNLPIEIKQRLGQKEAGKQRAIASGHHLLLVLHKVPKHGSFKRNGVFFWRTPNGDWKYSGGGDGLGKLRSHIRAYEEAEKALMARYEKAISAGDYFNLLETLSPLRRAASNLLVALEAGREAISDDRHIIDFRDAAIDLNRTFELLYEDTKNALDYALAKQAEKQAKLSQESVRTAQRLNILAALFLPLTAITSIFGMNLHHGLNQESALLFWLVFGLGVSCGIVTKNWVLHGRFNPKS